MNVFKFIDNGFLLSWVPVFLVLYAHLKKLLIEFRLFLSDRSVPCSYSLMKDLNVLTGFVDDLLICGAFSVRSLILLFHLWKESG